MSEHQHIRADGTVTFLPHRLNRHPVVVRGLTADELWICFALSGGAGLLVGAPLSWVFRTVALAPTCIVLVVALRALGLPGSRQVRQMSRFKIEIARLQAHIKTLRLGVGALVAVALLMGGGWWSAPRDLTIHVPPDLR